MTDRDWEDHLRQVIVLADMQGASKTEVATAFDRGLREAHSERKPLIRWYNALLGWLIAVGILTHGWTIVFVILKIAGVL